MNKKILYIGLIVFLLLNVIILSGCTQSQDTIIDEISLYSGSTSVNDDYNLKDGTLSVVMFRGGEKKSKKKKLNKKQINDIEQIIKKYELQIEERKKDEDDHVGGSNSYLCITLKNDSNVYNSAKEAGLGYELGKYFEKIMN